ncbi:unnamed protein product [Rotaria socialis]|uniref:Condensation domain-containing protein n=1 Tax=Rotaria socialis TaxID=392032 RepID=A0A817RV12_9BILA|nr:unnamed protein product [Rotaria socialis]CAF4441499.1 unnamed protein product [Rotaria socialis]
MLYRACSLLRQHHPYFRLHVEEIDGKLWLIENENDNLPLTLIEGITDKWEYELINFANQSRDHTVSMIFLQCRYDSQGRHQLFGVINHVALDGLGFVEALHTLLTYLGQMCDCEDCKTVSLIDRHPFIDVLGRNPTSEQPVFNFTHEYLSPQGPDPGEVNTQHASSADRRTIGLFKKFDHITTENLIAFGKIHSTTVQGMLSISSMITSIWIRKMRPQFPIWVLNWCVSNLRPLAKPTIDPKYCVLATAPLAWEHEVNENASVWSLAQEASEKLHKHNKENMGWDFLNATKFGMRVKLPTTMTTSVGILRIRTEYGRVKVNDLRVMGANYDHVPNNASSHMNYIYIQGGQLNLVTTFTYPDLGYQWGERFHSGVIYILECFSRNSNFTVNSIFESLDGQKPCASTFK